MTKERTTAIFLAAMAVVILILAGLVIEARTEISILREHIVNMNKNLAIMKVQLDVISKRALQPVSQVPKGKVVMAREECLPQKAPEKKGISTEEVIKRFIEKRYHRVPDLRARLIAKNVQKVAVEEDVPMDILIAIMDKESNFNPAATSSAGATGLMQVMPFWANHIPFIHDAGELNSIYKGMRAGAYILSKNLKRAHQDIRKALAFYRGADNKDYVCKVLALAEEFNCFKKRLQSTHFKDHGKSMLLSMNGFGSASFDSLSDYPDTPTSGFNSFGPMQGEQFGGFTG